MDRRLRDLALFNLAIDSKLRGCDLVRLRARDFVHGDRVVSRATVLQRKTGQPMRFEVTEQTRDAVQTWIAERELSAADFLFTSRIRASRHLSTRQYARNVRGWIALIGLDSGAYGTHSLRRTKATLIYRRTMNRRAVQLLLRHANIQSTVAYLGSEVDDALEIAEHTEIQPHRFAFRNLTDRQRAKGKGHAWCLPGNGWSGETRHPSGEWVLPGG